MTASQSCKCAPHARWLSIGHGDARPHVPPSPQIVRQFVELDATRHAFISCFTVAQLVASARSKSAISPAALKSP